MRHSVIILCFLLTALMGFSYLAIRLSEPNIFLFHSSTQEAGQFLNTFRQTHNPRVEVNFSALYGGKGQFQVLHPIFNMQRLHFRDQGPSCGRVELGGKKLKNDLGLNAVCKELTTAEDLDSSDERFSNENEKKRDMLDRYLSEGVQLPESFIDMPPYVDSRGFSYAHFLSERDVAPYSDRIWIEGHLSLFKVSELNEILSKYQIDDPVYFVISKISELEMEEIVKGTSVVLTRDFLMIKNQSQFGFSPLSYWVYDVSELQNVLKTGENDLIPYHPDTLCLQRIGNACWTYSSKQAISYLYKYSLLILAMVGLAVIGFLFLYIRNLFEKNKEQRRQQLSLQVLSHEFRTPVSSLLLLTEQLSARLSQFDIKDQDLMTRMSSEVFKLQRIIEVGRTYLQTTGGRIQFKHHEIPSINSWIIELAGELNPKIRCHPLAIDQSLSADIFWLKFVLSNLVQNSFNHGAEPVSICLAAQQGALKITVQDQGNCEFSSLKQMSEPFVKSAKSKGMGLGLNIVKFIVEEWGNELQFSKSPTSFTLVLREQMKR